MRGNHTQSPIIQAYDAPSWLLTIIGALLGSVGLAYVIVHPEPVTVWAVEFVLVSVPSALIVYGGYWMATHRLTRADRWSIATWCLVGGAVAGALVAGYVVVEQISGETIIEPGELVLLGVLGGTFVSLYASILNERRHLSAEIGAIERGVADEMTSESLSADARLLAELALDGRSWNVIRLLLLAEQPLGVEAIADRIATIEDADRTDVYLDLVHVRLPKLAVNGLVKYNSDVDIVRTTERVSSVADASAELSATGQRLASAVDA